MKTVIAILILVLYTAFINWYIYNFDFVDKWHLKVYSTYANVIFLLWIAIADKIGHTSDFCSQIIFISRLTIVLNYILVLLYTLRIITDCEKQFFIINGSILATSIMVLTSGLRHGIYKD